MVPDRETSAAQGRLVSNTIVPLCGQYFSLLASFSFIPSIDVIITGFVRLTGPLPSESLYHVGMHRPPIVVFTEVFSYDDQMELQKRVAPRSCKYTLTRVGAPKDVANAGQ